MTKISFTGEETKISVRADTSAIAVDKIADVLSNSSVLDDHNITLEEI